MSSIKDLLLTDIQSKQNKIKIKTKAVEIYNLFSSIVSKYINLKTGKLLISINSCSVDNIISLIDNLNNIKNIIKENEICLSTEFIEYSKIIIDRIHKNLERITKEQVFYSILSIKNNSVSISSNILNGFTALLSNNYSFIIRSFKLYLLEISQDISSFLLKNKGFIKKSRENLWELCFDDDEKDKAANWKSNLENLLDFISNTIKILSNINTVINQEETKSFFDSCLNTIEKGSRVYISNLLNLCNLNANFLLNDYQFFKTYIDTYNNSIISNSTFKLKEDDFKQYFKISQNEVNLIANESFLHKIRKISTQTYQDLQVSNDEIENNLKFTTNLDILYECMSCQESFNIVEEIRSDPFTSCNYVNLTSRIVISFSLPVLLRNIVNILKQNEISDDEFLALNVLLEQYRLYYKIESKGLDFLRRLIIHNNLYTIAYTINILICLLKINSTKLENILISYIEECKTQLALIFNMLIQRIVDEKFNGISSFKQAGLKSNISKYEKVLSDTNDYIFNSLSKFYSFSNNKDIEEILNNTIFFIFDLISKNIIKIDSINIDDSLSLSKIVKQFSSQLKENLITRLFNNSKEKTEMVTNILNDNAKYKKTQEIIFVLNSNLKQIKNLLVTTNFLLQLDKNELISLIYSLFEDTPNRLELVDYIDQMIK